MDCCTFAPTKKRAMDIEYGIMIKYERVPYRGNKIKLIRIEADITAYDTCPIFCRSYPSKHFVIEIRKIFNPYFFFITRSCHSKIKDSTVEICTTIPNFITKIQNESLYSRILFITKSHYQFYRVLQNIPMILNKEQINQTSIDAYKNKFLKAIKENLLPYEER